MAIETRHNHVTFLPDGGSGRLRLTLDGEWTIRGGLAPELNTAVVPYGELAKLPTPVGLTRGVVEFWWSADIGAGDPDVRLDGWWLVDVSPETVGRGPGDVADSVQAYRLAFADHRHAFVPPRGARLFDGELNPDPPIQGQAALPNSELIRRALEAMNYVGAPPIPPGVIPASVDAVPPMRGVVWDGEHAPTALDRLLGHVVHVYVPQADGTGRIVRPNTGLLPVIPPDRLASAVVASSIDRRPTKVVVTSAPTAVVRTFEQGFYGAAGELWQFVVQDHADEMRWKPLGAVLGGTQAQANFRQGLPNVPAEWRDHYMRQAYRCIRLDPARFPPRECSILREALRSSDGTPGGPPRLKLQVALQDLSAGTWVNREATLSPRSIVDGEGVMVFDEYLGTVDPVPPTQERPDLVPWFVAAPAASLQPTFSVEDWSQARGQKRYAAWGYTRQAGSLVPMDGGQIDGPNAAAHLRGYRPDTCIYSAPELRVVVYGDTDGGNAAAMAEAAGQYAAELLADAGVARQDAVVKGFLAVDLSGRVSRISYSQRDASTSIEVDGWTVAGGAE